MTYLMRNVRLRVSILFFAFIIAGCGPQEISGTYLAEDDNNAILLQLTQSADRTVIALSILFSRWRISDSRSAL